jgi:phosphoglycolate phosphatase-like HAD superfamily hydrolase
VVTRDQVKYAKPDPDLFLAAAARLDAPIETAIIIGDAIWHMLAARRCCGFGVGLLSGGYGQEELERAGAARAYEAPPVCSNISMKLAARDRCARRVGI